MTCVCALLLTIGYLCPLRRAQLSSTPDFRYPVSASSMMDSNSDHYSSALVLRRPQKGRVAALRDEPSKVSSWPCHCCLVQTIGKQTVVLGLLCLQDSCVVFFWLGPIFQCDGVKITAAEQRNSNCCRIEATTSCNTWAPQTLKRRLHTVCMICIICSGTDSQITMTMGSQLHSLHCFWIHLSTHYFPHLVSPRNNHCHTLWVISAPICYLYSFSFPRVIHFHVWAFFEVFSLPFSLSASSLDFSDM